MGNFRSSLQTTVSLQSKRSGQYENGRTRPSETSVLFNSRSWLRLRIWLQTPTTSEWPINMLRYAFQTHETESRKSGEWSHEQAEKRAESDRSIRSLVAPTTTTTPTSSLLSMLQSVWEFTLSGLDGE